MNKEARGCSDRIATESNKRRIQMEKNWHDKTQEHKNGAKQAFSSFLSHNRTSKNAIQPKWMNEYVRALTRKLKTRLSKTQKTLSGGWKLENFAGPGHWTILVLDNSSITHKPVPAKNPARLEQNFEKFVSPASSQHLILHRMSNFSDTFQIDCVVCVFGMVRIGLLLSEKFFLWQKNEI